MRARGVSLIEMVFTATLVSLIFIFLMNVIPTAMFSVRQSEHRSAAMAMAQLVLDECSTRPFEEFPNGTFRVTDPPGPLPDMLRRYQAEMQLEDRTVLNPELRISDVGSGVRRDHGMRVQVTVSWKERNRILRIERSLVIPNVDR